MLLPRRLFLLLTFFLTLSEGAAQVVSSADTALNPSPFPEWVVDTPLDLESPAPVSPSGISAGIYYRLVEQQANAETQERFYRYADEFMTHAGIHDFGELSIDYDPQHETLSLHFIHILRPDGAAPGGFRTIDLMEISRFRHVLPDEELEEGLFEGHSRLLIFLRDLRPGDVLEYAYTLKGALPVFDDYFMDSIPLRWSVSVQENRYRLLKSADRPIYIKNFQTSLTPTERTLANGMRELSWVERDVAPQVRETRVPAWYRQSEWIQLSQFESWSEVAQWGAPFYDFSAEPLSGELKTVVDDISQAHDSEDGRVMAAVRFVQDDIRYLGIEEGDHAFRPVSPNFVAERRFGDCKDKTALLGRLLHELGTKSDPVYVSFRTRSATAERHPSPLAFDHVILRIETADGRELFCDTTDQYQGGRIESLPFSDFGYGLIVNETSTELAELPLPDTSRDFYEVVEHFTVGDVRESTLLEVVTTYHGSEADRVRYYFAGTESAAAERNYLDYYREHYPAVQFTQPFTFEDDREANQLVVREYYDLGDPWEMDDTALGYYSLDLYLEPIRNILTQPDIAQRSAPFAIGSVKKRKHRIVLELPSLKHDENDSWFFEDENLFIEPPEMEFRRSLVWDDETEILEISSEVETFRDAVDPADVEAWVSKTDQVYSSTHFAIWRYLIDEDPTAGDVEEESISEEMSDISFWIQMIIWGGCGMIMAAGIGFAIGVSVNRKQRQSGATPPPIPRYR